MLATVTLLATVVAVCLVVRILATRRAEREALATIQSRNLAQALDQSISSTLQRIDLALGSVAGEVEGTWEHGHLNQARMEPYLAMEGRLLPWPGIIWIADASGRAVVGNRPISAVPPWATRWWFQYCQAHPDAGLVLSKPTIGFFTKKWVIPCVRRYNLPGGDFGGVVVIPFSVDYLQTLLQGYDVGPHGTLSLWDSEGGFIAAAPPFLGDPDAAMGKPLGSAQLMAFIRSGAQEWLHFGIRPSDHITRLFTDRRIKGTPMVVGAGLAEIDYLAPWRADRARTLLILGACLLGIWAVAWFLWQSWLGRERHTQALALLQAQLLQAQKMESLGTLAGGIAHDMNNVLGGILGMAELGLAEQLPGTQGQRSFSAIIRATDRAGKMVRSLLSFARQSPAEDHVLALNDILREEVGLLERTTLAKVGLELDLAADLWPIQGDAGALTHAFMNLCVNAVDAMADQGTLTLRTRNLDADWIEVCVEDTGTGMSPEVLAKALDPFFTTKGVGKGTGLGLAMVYSTVKAHRGLLELQSEPGRGTRVRIRFPVSKDSARKPETVPEAPALPARRLEVLLVDDDEVPRSATHAVLASLGHGVTAVPSGEEALARVEAGLRPDVVILDMNMPGLGGGGTLPRLRVLCPTVPVLLATGRADQGAMDLAMTQPGVLLLPKPFTIRELQVHLGRIDLHQACQDSAELLRGSGSPSRIP